MPLCLLLRLLLRMHLEELQDDDETANFGTPPHLQDIFPPSDEEHEPDLGPVSHCFLRVAVWTVTLYEG